MASISKVSDSKYRIRVSKQSSKRREFYTETFRGSLKEARSRAGDLERQFRYSEITAGKETLGAFLEQWLEMVRTKRAAGTYYGYKHALEKHLKPDFWDMRINQLRPRAFVAFFADHDTGKASVYRILKSALNDAVKWGAMEVNPLSQIQKPKKKHRGKDVLSGENLLKFLSEVAAHKHGLLFELMLNTGMRPGEALALDSTDFDFELGLVSVSKTLQDKCVTAARIAPAKTPSSIRKIALSAEIVAKVRSHIIRQKEEALRRGRRGAIYLFTGPAGGPLTRYAAAIALGQLLKAAGIHEKITLHSLRHTHLSLLLDMGFNITAIQRRAGHAKLSTTISTYLHPLNNMEKDIAARLSSDLYSDEFRAGVTKK